MAYAIKYLFKFESSNGTTREIRVLQDGYSGDVIQRPLGRAPVLKKQQNGPVHGTSLEFYAECHVDREFIEFYTSDPKAYRVDLYAGATLLWQGYITPELYSEPDIAPPYDVQVVATDGVGELKLYDYAAQGTVTLRALLSGLLSRTGLGTDIYLISSLKPGSAGAGSLLEKTINLDYMAGQTCYEVLTYILDTLHATITWWKGAWILTRETNVTFTNGKVRYFNTAGNSALLADSVQMLGKMYTNPAWPVGQLSTVIDPAKNRVTVQAPWHVVTCLRNSDMGSDADWTKAKNARYETDGYVLPIDINTGTSETAVISQATSMAGLRVPMSLSVKATGATSEISAQVVGAVLGVLLTYKVGNVTYHLVKGDDGVPVWQQGDDIGTYIPLRTRIDFQQPLATWDSSRIEAEELTIDNIPPFLQGTTFPAGTLTVYILGYCAKIYGAYLDVVLPKGYQDILRIDNGARGEGSEVEIAIGRETADNAYYAAFLQGLLLDSGNLITSFSDANFTSGMDYLAFIARDYALSAALPRAKVTGTVYLESGIAAPPLVFTKGALNYWLQTWSWSLYEDELEIEGLTLPSASLTVESETILESNGSTVSSAGGAGSSGAGSSIGGGGGTNYWEIDGTLSTLLKPKDAYAYVHSKDGLFFTGAALSGTVVPDLYVDIVNNQRVLRSPLPLITGGDQIVISGTPGGGGGGGATTLAGLDDTSISNPQAGQMLSWNGSKWVNTNAPTGSITSVSLAAGAANGTLHLVVNGTAQSDVAVTGLGSMAYKSSLAFSEITGSATISQVSGLQTALDGKQPSDADLTAIAGLSGTSGFLKKTAANTWSLDTNTYLTGITSSMVTNALGYTPANSTALANYVTLATAQTISALKTMTAGLKVSGRVNGTSGGDDEGVVIDFAENGYGGLIIGSPTGARSVFYFKNTEGYIPHWRYNNGTTSFDIQHPAKSGIIALTSDIDSAIEGLDSSTEAVSSGYFITGVTITNGKITARSQSNSISGSAARLTTVSKTAWGQTYWTANGVPDTISGDMSSVGNITPSTTLTKNLGSSSLFWGNAYVNKLYLTSSIYFYTETVGGTVCVRLNAPFITAGDQIVISGTPGGGGGGGATTLAGLDDVAITSVANGQLLQYNGSKWVNVAASSVGGVTSVAGYTGAVSAAQISSAIGLSGYVTLAGAETISGLKTFTSGLRVSGRAYSGGDDEGIVITWASNNYASLVLGSHNAERSVFTIHSGDAPKWVYNNGTNGYTITHPAKNGTIALTSDIPNVPGWALNSTKPSYTFAEITDKIVHSNEFNFIPTSFDGPAWFNFRSSGESTANVDEYRFGKGSATSAYASIRALSFIKDGGTSSQFLKADGSVDTNTYLTGNQTITLSGDVSGSGTTSIAVTIGQGKVTNAMLAGSIANGKLANSAITINGSSTSLGGSFSTASITAGTAGQSTASTGVSFSIPYVTMNAYGIVTGYGTHTHTISAQDLYDTIGSTKYAAYNADGYLPLSGGIISGTENAPLGINTTNTTEVGIRYMIGGTSKSFIGYHTTYGSYIYNHASQKTLGIKDDGTPYYSGSTLWHEGNSGTTSYPWACSTLTAATTATISSVEIGNTNEINGRSANGYDMNIHLNYRSTGNVTLAYGGGNVGVGITAPAYKLHVIGSAYADNLTLNGSISGVTSIDSLISFNTTSSIVSLASSSYFVENKPHYFRLNTNASWRGGMFWGSSGQESLAFVAANTGTTFRFCVGSDIANWTNATWQTATSQLVILNTGISVMGTIQSTGDQVISSDATLKENLTPVTYSVSDIAKARAVEFDWKDGRGHSMGSIAQDWLGIAPALVHGKEGSMSLAYGQLALVNTILLARQSESHEERIARLEKENAELKEEVKRLRMN